MTRDEQERPVHRVIDLATGAVTDTAITNEEWDAIDEQSAESARFNAEQLAAHEDLRRAVLDHPDPVVQALAKQVGLL